MGEISFCLLMQSTFWFVSCLFAVVSCATNCSYSDTDGSWDLSPLTYDPTGPAPANYTATDSIQGYTYYINFCETVSVDIGAGSCNADNAGNCQLAGSYINAGTYTDYEWIPFQSNGVYSSGIGLVYKSGDFCPSVGVNRQTTIFVACDHSAGAGYIASVQSLVCDYTIYFVSSYGCTIDSVDCDSYPLSVSVGGPPVLTYGNTKNAQVYSNGGCADGSSGALFYSVDVPANTVISASTCSSNTMFDTVLGIYSGSNCATLSCLAYNDNASNCTGGQSSVKYVSTLGGTYIISVSGANGASGKFQLGVTLTANTPQGPVGGCSDAYTLPLASVSPISVQGTNANSTVSTLNQCSLLGNKAIWYYVENNNFSSVTVSTCNNITNFDAQISIFDGTCSEPTCALSADPCSGNGASATFVPTGSFYIVVYGSSGAVGNFELTVTRQ